MSSTPQILFENDLFLVVNKPAGWLSVPAREPKPTDLVLSHWARDQSSSREAWVVHRLDRFTSGIILFAKSEGSQKTGNTWFEERIVKKVYQFLAAPPPSRPAIQIKTPVDGKSSQTLFEVIQKTDTVFFGRATPLTGRFHQIREHAKDGGFPILGDASCKGLRTVSTKGETLTVPRVCLHAFSLETPVGKFEAPLADDIKTLWEKISHD